MASLARHIWGWKVNSSHLIKHLGVKARLRTIVGQQNPVIQRLQSFKTSASMSEDRTLFGEIFHDIADSGADILNVTQGAPGIRHLALAKDVLTKATTDTFTNSDVVKDSYVLQYGPRLGSTHARQSIAKFLSDGYADNVSGDNIVITGGATNGLQISCTQLLKPGDVVFVEDPTYFIAICMLKQDLNMTVVPVPADEKGLDVDAYEKLLEKYVPNASANISDKHPFNAMLYMVPTYNNPRGYCLPPDRCRRLAHLARKYQIINFCDDVYNLLHFDGNTRAPPRFLTYDNPSDANFKGHTISNGTFSKILAPGLRLGWMETSQRIVDMFRKSNVLWSAGCTNHYTSEIVATALDQGLQQSHLRDMNIEYKTKIANLIALMKKTYPDNVKFNHIEGGYFIWIELPKGVKGADVSKLALQKYDVRIMPGANCSPEGNFQNCLRMSISYLDEDVLLEAAKRVGQAIQEVLTTKATPKQKI